MIADDAGGYQFPRTPDPALSLFTGGLFDWGRLIGAESRESGLHNENAMKSRTALDPQLLSR